MWFFLSILDILFLNRSFYLLAIINKHYLFITTLTCYMSLSSAVVCSAASVCGDSFSGSVLDEKVMTLRYTTV